MAGGTGCYRGRRRIRTEAPGRTDCAGGVGGGDAWADSILARAAGGAGDARCRVGGWGKIESAHAGSTYRIRIGGGARRDQGIAGCACWAGQAEGDVG